LGSEGLLQAGDSGVFSRAEVPRRGRAICLPKPPPWSDRGL